MYLISQELLDAAEQRVVTPVHFIFIDWPDGPVYAHNHVGPIAFDGKVWYGMGALSSIGEVECNTNIGSHTMNLGLSGIDPKSLTEIVTKNVIGRDVEAYFGLLDENSRLIDATPYFYGRVSSTNIKRYGNDSVSVTATSKTSDWGKSRPDRFTDESFRAKHPGDYFFQYVAQMADRDIYWGSDKESAPLIPRK